MSLTAFVLVVLSAFLHAGWNLFGKKVSPTVGFFTLAFIAGVLPLTPLTLPLAVDNFALLQSLLPYLVVSGFCQALYSLSLARAYATGEISVAYPLARALPVLLVAGSSVLVGLPGISSPSAYFGVFLLLTGALLLPLRHWRELHPAIYYQPSTLWALGAALATTGYSIADKLAISLLDAGMVESALLVAVFYIWLEGIAATVFLLAGQCWHPKLRLRLWQLLQEAKGSILTTGLMITLTYLLVLWAMQLGDNLSYVVALRQISIPIGALLGILWFREYLGPTKLLALLLLCCGLVLIVLT